MSLGEKLVCEYLAEDKVKDILKVLDKVEYSGKKVKGGVEVKAHKDDAPRLKRALKSFDVSIKDEKDIYVWFLVK